MNEFEFIRKLLQPLAPHPNSLKLSDDIALLSGNGWVFSTDTICENIHFLENTKPYNIAQKLLRVNISDLSAKAINAKFYSLNLSLNPKKISKKWLEELCFGLQDIQQEFNISLLGGDTSTTNNDIILSATIFGQIKEKYIARNTAKAGDLIFVTGFLGDSFLGLKHLLGEINITDNQEYFINRYEKPRPRIEIINLLQKVASSALDISDGLLQDLNHISNSSNLSATVFLNNIPITPITQNLIKNQKPLQLQLLNHGDDYEILFTAAKKHLSYINSYSSKLSYPITQIGKITNGSKVTLLDKENQEILYNKGFMHFDL